MYYLNTGTKRSYYWQIKVRILLILCLSFFKVEQLYIFLFFARFFLYFATSKKPTVTKIARRMFCKILVLEI